MLWLSNLRNVSVFEYTLHSEIFTYFGICAIYCKVDDFIIQMESHYALLYGLMAQNMFVSNHLTLTWELFQLQ